MKNISIAILPVLLSFAASCSTEPADTYSEEELYPVSVGLTRSFVMASADASDPDRTFGFTLLNQTTGIKEGEGSYIYPAGGDTYGFFVPCRVNPLTGMKSASADAYDNRQYGLRAKSGTYDMAIASPAVSMTTIPGSARYGFQYERTVSSDAERLYISDGTIPVTLKSNYMRGEADGKFNYIYSIPEDRRTLIEHRSSLTLRLECGPDMGGSVAIGGLSVSGLADKAYYDPQTALFDTKGSVISAVEQKFITSPITVDYGTPYTVIASADAVPLLSIDYSRVDANTGEYIWTVPVMMKIKEAGQEIELPLRYNFLPHMRYDITVTVNTAFIFVRCSVCDWSVTPASADEIAPAPQVFIKTETGDWIPLSSDDTIDGQQHLIDPNKLL